MVGRILIVDDVATNRIVLKVKLAAACYQPLLAVDGESSLRLIRQERPDLVLLDLSLPDISGIEVLRRIRADAGLRDIPVIVFSPATGLAARLAALAAGADDILPKPVDDQVLMARIRSLLRGRDPKGEEPQRATLRALGLAETEAEFEQPGSIALLSGAGDPAAMLRQSLSGYLRDRLLVLHPQDALNNQARPTGPDLFVIDADLAGRNDGLRLMSELRSRPATRHAAICIRQEAGATDAATIYDLGADDVVPAGIDPQELALRLRRLLRRKRDGDRTRARIETGLRLAMTDPLTGLYNRRYALPELSAMADRAASRGGLAVMVVDLDRFKTVNDRWGHAAGDAVLVEVARRLGSHLAPGDLLARIGGEEFLIALTESEGGRAQHVAQRLCRTVEEHPITLPSGQSASITVSIGIAVAAPAATDRRDGTRATSTQAAAIAALVDRADRALLVAKAEGRNQVTMSCNAA